MTKKHFVIILLIFAVLLGCNIITFVLLVQKNGDVGSSNVYSKSHNRGHFLKEKLELTAQQAEAFDIIRNKYKCKAKELDIKLKNNQRDYILLISENNYDDEAIDKMKTTRSEIIELQDSLFVITINQYKEYREVLDTARQNVLQEVYLKMFKCKDCRHKKCERNGQ